MSIARLTRSLFLGLTVILAPTSRGQILPLTGAVAAPPINAADGVQLHITDQYSYDDNLFRVPGGFDLHSALGPDAARGDHSNTAAAGLDGQWTAGHQVLSYGAQVDATRFSRNHFLDYVSERAQLALHWRLGNALWGEAGADYQKSLAGFTNTRSFVKDLIATSEYFADGNYQLGPRWSLFGGVRDRDITNSADVRRIDNLQLASADLGVLYALSPRKSVGWEYQRADGRYRSGALVVSGVPIDRDFTDESGRLLAKCELDGVTSVDGSVGYLRREYPKDSPGNFSGGVWRATLQWQPLAKSRVVFSGWRDLYAYLDTQSNYFVDNGKSIAPTWTPTEKLQLALTFAWEKQDYIESSANIAVFASRRDRVTSQQATLSYTPADSLSVSLSYRSENRQSNLATYSYIDRITMANIAFKFR